MVYQVIAGNSVMRRIQLIKVENDWASMVTPYTESMTLRWLKRRELS